MTLPYHCPTFRTDHLLEPCQKNLARVKALQEKKKHVGPLERCVECKGKMLVTVPRTIIEGLPAPENWVEERFVPPEPKEYVSPERKGWDPVPELRTAPLFLKDVKEAPVRNKSLEEGRLSTEAEAMVVHPVIPPRKESPPERAVDHNLGKKYKKREKALPAVKITEKEAEKLGITIVAVPRPMDPDVDPEAPDLVKLIESGPHPYPEVPLGARYCPTHPEVVQRVDKLGRWMGMCAECLSARGEKCGKQNFERGVTAPPVSIPLNMPKYADVKKWLEAQAEENERTLMNQVMYILKIAWREGTGDSYENNP